MPYRYTLYGLKVACDFPLTGLEPESADESFPADVSVQKRAIAVAESSAIKQYLLRSSPDEAVFVYPSVGAVLVRGGREIWVDLFPRTDETTLTPLILGTGMSVLLTQRGLTVLHASCVLIGDSAVAFVGRKGDGKSVMAASLAHSDCPLISDDVTALDLAGDPISVLPAARQIRLLPDALNSLGVDAAALPKVYASSPKRIWRAAATDLPPTVPLRRIYVLAQADQVGIEPLAPVDAFVQLLRHAYLSRWSSLAHQTPDHFQNVSALANRVPVFRLSRPHNFAQMPDLIRQLKAAQDDP